MSIYSEQTLALIPDPALEALGYPGEEQTRHWLCVVWEFTDGDNPIIHRHYYPVRKVDPQFYAPLEGRRVQPYVQGAYRDNTGATYYLKDRGGTLPIHTTQRPAPAPRAKELRWVRGGWEKYTKAKGWERVAIPRD